MTTASLREALNRVAVWERHHTPSVPRPHRPALKTAEERLADSITAFAGSLRFVYLHTAWFGLWIVINLGLVAAALGGLIQPFDPFPFGLLTMVVSLEAIFLSTFVMISQNRQAEIADHRAELDYQVNVKAEAEIAKLLVLVEALVSHHAELNGEEPREPGPQVATPT
ncbi:MAG TPA: DUF1003 domain-containing protein [Chloroflexota bacterium]|jgi:uncharacterized membrane protein